jgi:two-component system response regulator ResD
MTKRRILIVEDRISIRTLMTDYLAQQGYDVSQAQNGIDALKLCRTHTYDCVLLDLMMPQMDGMTFLCELRQISMVPVIVMSAKLEEFDKIEALNAGADEYITKPVGMREVVARVQAIIRRVNNMPTFGHLAPQNQINAFTFDEQRRTVFLNNEPVPLTNTEYKIIIHMLKNTGKIITRQEFGQILYGSDAIKIDRSIDMHIKNIRHKIEPDLENPIYIMTVYGVGYRMNTTIVQ